MCIELLNTLLETIKNFLLATSTIVGMYVALKGLQTWHKQITGERLHLASLDLIRSVVKIKNSLNRYRNRFESPEEIRQSFKAIEGREFTDFNETKKKPYVKLYRIQQVNETLGELDLAEIDAEILFNEKVKSELNKIRTIITKIDSAEKTIQMFKNYPEEKIIEKSKEVDSIIYYTGKDDIINKEITEVIKNLKYLLKKYLQ